MSFWNHFGFQPSPIDTLLEKADVTLEQLMDEPDLIQECKSQNRKLIEFCVQKSVLEKIIDFVAVVPDQDANEKFKVKYPDICTDILCAEVWQFSDAVYGNSELLKKLYSFFEKDPEEMNEAELKVANNCAKCITSLLHRKGPETLKFLRGYPDITERFVAHVSNPTLLDYILRLIGDDDTHSMMDDLGDTQPINEDASTVSWLCEQKFIELLIDKFVTATKEETQQAAGMMLFELASSLSTESAIIASLESLDMVDKLFSFITNIDTITNRRSVSLCGFSTLIELLRKKRVATYQDETDPNNLPSLVVGVSSHLRECKEFLEKAPLMPAMETTFGTLDPPLGLARQSVLELVESLALTNSAYVFKCLYESRFMESAIDLFFMFPWNNFAHQSVFNIIATVLPQENKELCEHIMRDCKLMDRILKAEEENKKFYSEKKAALGYIGHLTKISSLINSLASREAPEGLFASEVEAHQPEWDTYSSESLKLRNENESILLGGNRPGMTDMYSLGDGDSGWTHDDDSDSDGEVVMCEDAEDDEEIDEEADEVDEVEAEDGDADDYDDDDDDELDHVQETGDDDDDEVVIKGNPEDETMEKEEASGEEEVKEEEAPAEEKKEETPAEEEKKEEVKEEEAPAEKKEEEAPAEEVKESQ